MPDENPKLDVLRLSWAGIRMPFEDFGAFVWMAWFPLGVAAASQLIFGGFGRATGIHTIYWFYTLPAAIAAVSLNVGWKRLAVIGKDGISGRPYFDFTDRELKFLIASLLILLLSFGPAALTGAFLYLNRDSLGMGSLVVGWVSTIALLIVGVAASVRLAFIFPAIAVDRLGNLSGVKEVWQQTSGSGWRLFGIWMVVGLPFQILLQITVRPYRHNTDIVSAVMIGAITLAVTFIQSAATTGAIALAYREIAGPPANPSSS
ncbi:MAG TPA: hypothetical protein VMU16_14940 [Candidatus Binataceae bacterium]|nr:hypothetical protein [Candidatus Binataceae bacterium]